MSNTEFQIIASAFFKKADDLELRAIFQAETNRDGVTRVVEPPEIAQAQTLRVIGEVYRKLGERLK